MKEFASYAERGRAMTDSEILKALEGAIPGGEFRVEAEPSTEMIRVRGFVPKVGMSAAVESDHGLGGWIAGARHAQFVEHIVQRMRKEAITKYGLSSHIEEVEHKGRIAGRDAALQVIGELISAESDKMLNGPHGGLAAARDRRDVLVEALAAVARPTE